MLSLSAELSQASVDLQLVNGVQVTGDGDVAHARTLADFAGAIALRDDEGLALSRDLLQQQAGPEVVVDAAAVAANFQRMVRIADCTGIPLDTAAAAMSAGVRKELELGRFHSAQNTPRDGWKVKLLSRFARPLARRMLKIQR
jgi:hypothetical protein